MFCPICVHLFEICSNPAGNLLIPFADLKSPGVALFLQNTLICIASIIFKFGRSEDVY